MSIQDRYQLKENPFRITPAVPNELIWAGFQDVKEKFEKRIKRSLKIRNSSLVLNWGEYGSGKTHAARFFNKKDTLQNIINDLGDELPLPYSVVMTLPKGKNPIYDIYVSIIDKLNIQKIRDQFEEIYPELETYIESITDNLQMQNLLKALFKKDKDNKNENLLKKYLYGNLTKTELKSLTKQNIHRNLGSDNDYISFLSGFFSCITFDRKVYSAVIIWIDEFEDLAILSSSNIDKTNNFLREIIDQTPNHLLIFLNLTQSALFGLQDLGEYLYESVRSRIKERINFDIPNLNELLIYTKDILSKYRIGKVEDPFFPFNEDLIIRIHNDIGNVSLRTFNEALSLLLELGDLDEKKLIDLA
ncbi:MAG: hypothetical protein WD607_02085 [Candidatus Paceibacterota bacterium]